MVKQILIVEDGIIRATHFSWQYDEVKDLYPGCEVIQYEGEKKRPEEAYP